jgi:histidyl-tRNA synthetase
MVTPRIFKGTRDFLPDEMVGREKLIDTIKDVFRKYGFLPMETPSMEFMEILAGKYGDDEKLIYKLAYKGGNELALRYDLTVPLSRAMGMNPHLHKPFKRYQIQPVWRADRPQLNQGRYREFYQCDADTIGTTDLLADAEVIALTNDILVKLGFTGYKIRINHRRLLSGLIEYAGFPQGEESNVCRSLDKLLKIGWDGVKTELSDKGYDAACFDRLTYLLNSVTIGQLDSPIFSENENLEIGAAEMREVRTYCRSMGIADENLHFDLTLARGLNYYTGCIYESKLDAAPHIGSLTGGGRYDNLIGTFSKNDIPAVGTTIGLDRIMTAMKQLEMPMGGTTTTEVLVVVFGDDTRADNVKLVSKLRKDGVQAEIFLGSAKMKRQFEYADRKGIPLVAMQGDEEIAAGTVKIKNMQSGDQQHVPLSGLADKVREILAK